MSLINLLPEDFLRRKRAMRANRMCLTLFVVVMAGVLTAAGVSHRCRSNTQSVLDRVDEEYQQANSLMTELAQLQDQKQVMMEKARSTSMLLERVPRSYLLAMITNSMPPNASLVQVKLYPRQIITPAQTAVAKDGKFASKAAQAMLSEAQITMEMEITGVADTDVGVARFIANLARNPLADSVDLVFSQEKNVEITDVRGKVLAKPLLREFQVRLALRGDLDVMDVIGKKAAAQVAAAPVGSETRTGARP